MAPFKTPYISAIQYLCMRLRFVFYGLALMVLAGCGSKKKKPSDENITVEDFLGFFPSVPLPYQLNDSVLQRKEPDSLQLSVKAFHAFVPDSVYLVYFGQKDPLLYPVGRVTDRRKGNYLLLKSKLGKQGRGYLFYFNSKNKYVNSMLLAKSDDDPKRMEYGRIDNKYNISHITEVQRPGGFLALKELIYGLTTEGDFALIMTNSNEEIAEKVIVNPIDTLARKNKWSGDYLTDKKNFVSVRDGINVKEYKFFIHFSKSEGACSGELRGTAELLGENKLKFTDRSGPCGIEFNFTGTRVSIREVGGCGSYRDVSCYFEGSYPKKKESKPKPNRKKS